MITVPPLLIDLIAEQYALPAERCLDDCRTLVYAYAQLGIPAQVRAAELTITNTSTGTSVTKGSLAPWWEDGMIHGHIVVWLPDLGHLVDATAGQYPHIASPNDGPIVAVHIPPPDGTPDQIQLKRKCWRHVYLDTMS